MILMLCGSGGMSWLSSPLTLSVEMWLHLMFKLMLRPCWDATPLDMFLTEIKILLRCDSAWYLDRHYIPVDMRLRLIYFAWCYVPVKMPLSLIFLDWHYIHVEMWLCLIFELPLCSISGVWTVFHNFCLETQGQLQLVLLVTIIVFFVNSVHFR